MSQVSQFPGLDGLGAQIALRVWSLCVAAMLLTATAGASADSPWLYGLHFWGTVTDPVPANLLDCPTYGGWDLEVILTHGDVWAGAPYYVYPYSVLSGQKVSPITRIDYNWGQTVPSPTNPDYAGWPASVASSANYLRPYAHIWIVGNEPNLVGEANSWPSNHITPAGYATIYRNVRNAIRALPASPAGPHRVLIAPVSPGGVIAGVRWISGTDWLSQVIDNIPADEIDGFALHAYGGSVTDFHNSYVEQLNLIDSKSLADRPVYMTEWNRYATPGNAAEEAAAAQFCRDAFADVHTWNTAGHHNIVCMCWFVFDGTSDGSGAWDGYSIEYWKSNGNPYGNPGDLYTAFEYAVDQRYPAGAIGTPGLVPPVAAFAASMTDGIAPFTVTFTDQSTGTISTRSWNFGDGGTSTDTNPVHTYASPGVYTVTLTLTSPVGGDTETKTNYIGAIASETCGGQRLTAFEGYGNGTQVMFRNPRYSGTTLGHLAASPDVSAVTDEVLGYDGRKACKVQFQWLDTAATRWLRLTTADTAVLPNPTVDLTRAIRLRLRLDSGAFKLCVGVRETGVDVPAGSNGGTSGTIEWVGATSVTNNVPQGVTVTAKPGVWQTFTFLPRPENVKAFTGDGVLSAPNHKGVLEHLALTPTTTAGPITVYFDAIEQPCPVRADFDGDGDVDQEDFGHLQACITGDYAVVTDPNCQDARLDADTHIDTDDVNLFANCLMGAGVMPDPDCLP